MTIDIPGSNPLTINTVLLDLNGTLSVGGQLVPGVGIRLLRLVSLGLRPIMLTGNTRGDAEVIANKLDIEWRQASTALDKRSIAKQLGPQTIASIGNGRIDLELHQTVALSIVTLQAEGVHSETLVASDLIVPTINDALDLLIDPNRLIASLRK